jgi:hypothetical protein
MIRRSDKGSGMSNPFSVWRVSLLSLVVGLGACGGGESTTPSGAGAAGGSTGEGGHGGGAAGAGGDGGDSGCVIRVELGGSEEAGCGDAEAPCGSITGALKEAKAGCRVQVGAGTYTAATGEAFPLELLAGIELAGEGANVTVIDDTAGTASKTYPTCHNDMIPVLVSEGTGVHVHSLTVAGRTNSNKAATVLVVGGDVEIADAVITGGQDGIFVQAGSAHLHDLEVSGAGHAAIKPAGSATVMVERADIHHNKDAVEPICESTVTVSASKIHCNGNGIEALGRATTTAIDNHVSHNNIGFVARGGDTSMTLRGNLIEKNKYGVMEIFGQVDLGSSNRLGGNTLTNNRHVGLYAKVVPKDIFAIGNIWQPDVDGADGSGKYTGDVFFSAGPSQCPNVSLAEIDTAWDAACEQGFEMAVTYQNVAIDDGTCQAGTAMAVGRVIVSE